MSGWTKLFTEREVGRWKILLGYGPNGWWHQFRQGDGGAFALGWFTVIWNRCVCAEPNWYYCSFHRKSKLGGPSGEPERTK